VRRIACGDPQDGYAEGMEPTEKKAREKDVQHEQDVEERDDQRREDDTKSGARRPDTGASDDPPEPFTGPSH
jgi:hypothetical protein